MHMLLASTSHLFQLQILTLAIFTIGLHGLRPLTITLLHLIFHFRFILLFHILILEPEFGSEQTCQSPSDSDSDLSTYIYTLQLLVDTQFEYQLGLAKSLSNSKSTLLLSSLQPPLHWTISYSLLHSTFSADSTLLINLRALAQG